MILLLDTNASPRYEVPNYSYQEMSANISLLSSLWRKIQLILWSGQFMIQSNSSLTCRYLTLISNSRRFPPSLHLLPFQGISKKSSLLSTETLCHPPSTSTHSSPPKWIREIPGSLPRLISLSGHETTEEHEAQKISPVQVSLSKASDRSTEGLLRSLDKIPTLPKLRQRFCTALSFWKTDEYW